MYDVRTRQFGKWLLKSATASGQFSFQHGYTFPFLERGRVAVSVLLKRKRQYYKTSQSPLWQNEKNPFVCCTLHTLHTVSRLTLPGSYSQHSRFGQAAAAHRFTHTDLRLISSRSRVLERHVNVSLSRLFDSANRISLFQTSRVPPPSHCSNFSGSWAASKRNWKRRERKPRAFVRDACARALVRSTRKWNDVRQKLRTAFPSISSTVAFVFLLLLPRKLKQTAV